MSGPLTVADDAPSDRAAFYRRVALAPLCLCLVAGLHLYRVATAEQTPWKGGGFGMFSTVDSESARYLRCYVIAADGTQLPLVIPPSLAKRAAELLAAPSSDGAKQLALRLAQRRWTQPAVDRKSVEELALAAAVDGRLSVDSLLASHRNAASDNEIVHSAAGLDQAAEALEAADGHRSGIDFREVRVEVWKYDFDQPSCELSGSKWFASDAPRPRVEAAEVQP